MLHLIGDVRISQQSLSATAEEAILWVDVPQALSDAGSTHKVITYLEGNVVVDVGAAAQPHASTQQASNQIRDERWLGRFYTTATVDIDQVAQPLGNEPPPEIYQRAQTALAEGVDRSVLPAAFVEPTALPAPVNLQTNSQINQPMLVSPQTGQIQQLPQPTSPQPRPTFSQPQPLQVPQQPLAQPVNSSTGISTGDPFQDNQRASPTGSSSSPISFQIYGRDKTPPNASSVLNEQNPNERISTLVGGVRIEIDSPELASATPFQGDTDRKLYIIADSLVQWSTTLPDGSDRNQFYLEGNVIFAKGTRKIFAERMFYDVEAQRGTILNAELTTTVPQYRGSVRMKADVIQQLDENNLQAYRSAVTSSQIGVPRYWLQSQNVAIERKQSVLLDPETSAPVVDPQTGQFVPQDEYFLDSQQNRVYVAGVPVFGWPRLRSSLSDPTLYLDRLGVNNDRIFGFQLTSGWNMYQLLGLERPPAGTRWIGLLDYLSDRGIGIGSEFDYRRNSLFGIPGQVRGDYQSWFIQDDGLDFLGADRRDLIPEEDNRGRISARHRHDFSPGYALRAELGYISDRNFLEQYYEREWDTQKDATTGFWLERNFGTVSNNVTGDLQVNDFFAQTSGLKLDQFILGQPVFNNRAIWHSHSHAGYVRLRQADAPTTAVELAKFDPLAWEADVDGFRAGTRNELDFPMQVGPVKVIPYLLGDATYWQEDLTGNDLTRVYGQTGVRASLPMWRVDPSVQSTLWNVNGLAHKVNFEFDAFYADASQDLDELPLYDPLDDDAQEHFRRRFAFDTFGIGPGGDVPLRYDERYFALRSGMQSNVTAPSAEIADDLAAVKFGVRQRWQTKRGVPGRERIVDWITLDAQTMLFPDADRDNFGADLGMFDYDFRWHVGDRFSLVSDGYFDFFSQGLRTASFGGTVERPEIGNLYLGYRMIEGPISSNILSAALTYRMSDKWGVKAGGQVDFGETGSIGQNLSFVYIGESFLWQLGLNYDVSRDNLGFRFGFEPRFGAKPRLFRPGGVPIPPASSRWLE